MSDDFDDPAPLWLDDEEARAEARRRELRRIDTAWAALVPGRGPTDEEWSALLLVLTAARDGVR